LLVNWKNVRRALADMSRLWLELRSEKHAR
jgi:hypothetical protein